METNSTDMTEAPAPKKPWGLQKAASALTKVNKGKKRVDVGNVREILKSIVQHDLALIKAGGQGEIILALEQELGKKLSK
jgi:hypothetical protein